VTGFRFSVTPRTAARLDEAYAFVADFGFANSHVTAMPVAGVEWSEEAYQALRAALLRIAETGYKAHREGRYMPFRYNDCLANNDLMQALFPADGRAESCMWGEKMMGISSEGEVYPCYILPEMAPQERDPFKIGSIYHGGIPSSSDRRKSWNFPESRNLARSCHVWNALVGGDPFRPLPVYKHFYRYYIEAAIRLMSLIHPENAEQYKKLGLIKLKEHL
jgi:MoaA/NifB/PqqE/SkfB family radical SAM enzyme